MSTSNLLQRTHQSVTLATLIYLAVQIRQNTLATHAASRHAIHRCDEQD